MTSIMREDEVDALAEADRALDEEEVAAEKVKQCDKFIALFTAIFDDFKVGIDSAARNCRNNDASTALYEVSSAIEAMDIPFVVRQTMDVPNSSLLRI